MKQFRRADYIKQADKWARQRNGGSLSVEEMIQIRDDAKIHIGNIFPDWNSWDEARQIQELRKSEKSVLVDALTSCVDGGEKLPFVLPAAVNVELIKRVQEPLTEQEVIGEMDGYKRLCEAKGIEPKDSEAIIKKRIEWHHNQKINDIVLSRNRDGETLLEKTILEDKKEGLELQKLLFRARAVTYVRKKSTSRGISARLSGGRSAPKLTGRAPRRRRSEGR